MQVERPRVKPYVAQTLAGTMLGILRRERPLLSCCRDPNHSAGWLSKHGHSLRLAWCPVSSIDRLLANWIAESVACPSRIDAKCLRQRLFWWS
jgi:hypothetical protein